MVRSCPVAKCSRSPSTRTSLLISSSIALTARRGKFPNNGPGQTRRSST
jgi:hypothetical protein